MAEQLQSQTPDKSTGVKRALAEINTECITQQPTTKKRRLCTQPSKPFPLSMHHMDFDEISECTKTIHTSITVSHITRNSTLMTPEIATAARKYYLHIVDDSNTTFVQKKQQIYHDLVIGNKSDIKLKEEELKHNTDEFELKYQIGINNQDIKSIKGSVITLGRYEENDICSEVDNRAISRIQCFIFIIDDSLIVMDGWSLLGTKTIKVNDNKDCLHDSLPTKRMLLRFNKTDNIHLRFGDICPVDLMINPKECVVCMDKARVIRNSCGHYALCRDCYQDILTQSNAECPICRTSIKSKPALQNNSIATYVH